jgi:hypothetical protein
MKQIHPSAFILHKEEDWTMKNRVEIEGYVTNRIWQWQEPERSTPDTLFRLACYPDGNGRRGGRARPFYVTVRVHRSVLDGIPVGVLPEQRLLVTGRLVSRDYAHSLADFLARVKDLPELTLPAGFDPQHAVELRSLNEVIAESMRVIEEQELADDVRTSGSPDGNHRLSRRERRRAGRQADVTAQPVNGVTTSGVNVTHSPDGATLQVNTITSNVSAVA